MVNVLKKKSWLLQILALLALALSGCGELRNSYLAPEAKTFHPKTIAILPVEVGVYGEAGGVIDQIIAGVLSDKKWFSAVIGSDVINQKAGSNEAFRKAVNDYLAKLKTLSFSDPDLSGSIGQTAAAEALLVANVDFWTYTVEKDKKLVRIGLGMKMADAATGKIMWKASHVLTEEYSFFRPELPDVARGLVKKMIEYMPH
ncbi:MAG: hypothetical protein HY742_05570 [Deltaproteobacteria bacterium]|nr:hypothetical protein [Deltaproteobacteria bacterium]